MVEFFNRSFCRNNFMKKLQSPKHKFFLWQKSSKISLGMLDKTFYVYNGSKFVSVPVAREFVGRAFGEFCFTKKITGDIHTKNKKAKKKKVKLKRKN